MNYKRMNILIPRRMQNEKAYRQMTESQFLKGYADSDSVYDLPKNG
jgi:hypothetical protein